MQLTTETKVGLFVLGAMALLGVIAYNLGGLRWYRSGQVQYTITATSAHGLTPKADVKIAGVSVGQVDCVTVRPELHDVAIDITVDSKYRLYTDATALVSQDGVLGPKSVELIPGTPLHSQLPPGGIILAVAPLSTESLMRQVRTMGDSLHAIVNHVQGATAQQDGKILAEIVASIAATTRSVEQLATAVQQTVVQNNATVTATIQELHALVQQLNDSLPKALSSVEQVAAQTNEVVSSVQEGKGLIGKLVNDDQIYQDLRVASAGLKKYFSTVDNIDLTVDFHSESMFRTVDCYPYPDSKGYVDVKLFTGSPYFYIFQMAGSVKGFPTRDTSSYCFYKNGNVISPQSLVLNNGEIIVADYVTSTKVQRNSQRYGIQLGRIFGSFAARVGLFDGMPGIGIDYILPFSNDKFRWVTTMELFDISGQNRFILNRRPHLKWINRLFFMKNIYVDFGMDDFISGCCWSPFLGVGFKFSDDDLKYFASQFSFLKS